MKLKNKWIFNFQHLVCATLGCVSSFQVHNMKILAHTLCIRRIWRCNIINPPYVTLHRTCVTAVCCAAAPDLKASLRLHCYCLMFTIGYCLSAFVDEVLILIFFDCVCSLFSTYTHTITRSWMSYQRFCIELMINWETLICFQAFCAQTFQIKVWPGYRLECDRSKCESRVVCFLLQSGRQNRGEVFCSLLWLSTLSWTADLHQISEQKFIYLYSL